MNDELNISEEISESFEAVQYNMLMLNFCETYSLIKQVLPPRNSTFAGLSNENVIACEVISAAICHQINWDFLRNAIYQTVIDDDTWILPEKLLKISSKKVLQILADYNKPERIREKERSSLLRSLGKCIYDAGLDYTGIFFDNNFAVKSAEDIVCLLNCSKAFSGDPEGKKTQLLLQNLSDYEEMTALNAYCKPAIDYHIIRVFLRRGLVIPKNQIARDFILNPNIQRREHTVAAIRKICADVFSTITWLTSLDTKTINTIEWWIGRSVCTKENPDCFLKTDRAKWLTPCFDKCPFYSSCYAISCPEIMAVIEPTYQGDSY
ncbi:hypothetical protein FACS18949_15100 [Clostridia bacterium]|nr:hypothetical protein FACS18949_15100 [Clostridia bacterium]